MASVLDTPRSSPTKRGHDSPTSSPSQPTKSAPDSDQPPLTKSSKKKLSYDYPVNQIQLPQPQSPARLINGNTADLLLRPTETGRGWGTNFPDTPPSPSPVDVLDDLAGGVEERRPIGGEIVKGVGILEQELQVRKLMEMPLELAEKLSRLSSQHQQSEYNNLKRSMAAAAAEAALQQQLLSFVPPPPLPRLPRPMATRSQSGPVLSTKHQIYTSATPNFIRPPVATNPIRTNTLTGFATPATVGTPPSIMDGKTSLTPTLMSFNFEEPASYNGGGTDIRDALADAIQSNLLKGSRAPAYATSSPSTSARPTPTTFTPVTGSQTPVLGQWIGLLPGMQVINGVPVKTSLSHPMNISSIIPEQCIASLSSRLFDTPALSKPKSPLTPSFALASNFLSSHSKPQAPFLIDSWPDPDLWDLTTIGPIPTAAETVLNRQRGGPANLGNFFLSSCPGKKVRLNVVAAKGSRGAVCRDLKTDLQRAQQEGVKLVICCLDDQELKFLGAPWEEYASAASQLELGVVRIPMPEGFAPSSPKYLDEQLSRIITQHTLRGESVLAHCRGGIGRAGVLACCWMIKMGFVRGENGRGLVNPMMVVEKVIEVIRRRRSVKSIETPQQAAFLLEFVEYLQQQANIVKAYEI